MNNTQGNKPVLLRGETSERDLKSERERGLGSRRERHMRRFAQGQSLVSGGGGEKADAAGAW